MTCVLCAAYANLFFTDTKNQKSYFHCPVCDLRFLNPEQRLNHQDELKRYLTHNNCVEDLGYQKFVEPVLKVIQSKFPNTAKGLDFGCGEGPVLSYLLEKNGFKVDLYDPFFKPDRTVLSQYFDFIFSIEVIEHFFDPAKEFQFLKSRLNPDGSLLVMTHIFTDSVDFSKWYYRVDPTHVCFFSAKTFNWIKEEFKFKGLDLVGDRVAVFNF